MNDPPKENRTVLCIVGIGEVLWDVFPEGPQFGGAPANFACSAAGLGGDTVDVSVISSVGNDELGQMAIQELRRRNVSVAGLSSQDRVTGQVIVSLDELGQASYRFLEDTAWDSIEWTNTLQSMANQAQAVCFGTLGQRDAISRQTIRKFLLSTSESCLRILDVNLRTPYWDEAVIIESLPLANVLKLNSDELPVVASLLKLHGEETSLLQQIRQRFQLKLVALTRGPNGSVLLSEDGVISEVTGQPVSVVDTVGAGDSFTAAITIGMLLNLPLEQCHLWADSVARWLCTQSGANPDFPVSLKCEQQMGKMT